MKFSPKVSRLAFSSLLIGAILLSYTFCRALDLPGSGNNDCLQSEMQSSQPQDIKVFWGKPVEGLKAGLSVDYCSLKTSKYFSDRNNLIPTRCFPLLSYQGTNFGGIYKDVLTLDLPTKVCYRMELVDESGKSVRKSVKATDSANTLPQHYKISPNALTGAIVDTGHRPFRYFLEGENLAGALILPFMLQDYFIITNAGKYQLSFQMCVFVPGLSGYNSEHLMWLPPVTCGVEIKKDPQER